MPVSRKFKRIRGGKKSRRRLRKISRKGGGKSRRDVRKISRKGGGRGHRSASRKGVDHHRLDDNMSTQAVRKEEGDTSRRRILLLFNRIKERKHELGLRCKVKELFEVLQCPITYELMLDPRCSQHRHRRSFLRKSGYDRVVRAGGNKPSQN